jgi:hypothetical protein
MLSHRAREKWPPNSLAAPGISLGLLGNIDWTGASSTLAAKGITVSASVSRVISIVRGLSPGAIVFTPRP